MGTSDQIETAAAALETQGFYVFENFFNPAQVQQAREEVVAWLDADVAERASGNVTTAWHKGTAGTTILTKPTHLMLDAYAKSPTLDQMVETVLTNEWSRGVLNKLVGEHIKLRGYNVQKLTGANDPRPEIGVASNPHEWHRDSLGEIGIGIFLEDVPGPGNGATSIVRGSHYFPFCPRWNSLFGPPYIMRGGGRGLEAFLRFNIFSRLLARRVLEQSTGAYGKQGDFYIFINDAWHGREPNVYGGTGIKVMIGAFACDDPFPDEVIPPPAEVLGRLPPRLRDAAAQTMPAAPVSTLGTIMKRLRERQAKPDSLLFDLARSERRIADGVSAIAKMRFRWKR